MNVRVKLLFLRTLEDQFTLIQNIGYLCYLCSNWTHLKLIVNDTLCVASLSTYDRSTTMINNSVDIKKKIETSGIDVHKFVSVYDVCLCMWMYVYEHFFVFDCVNVWVCLWVGGYVPIRLIGFMTILESNLITFTVFR